MLDLKQSTEVSGGVTCSKTEERQRSELCNCLDGSPAALQLHFQALVKYSQPFIGYRVFGPLKERENCLYHPHTYFTQLL